MSDRIQTAMAGGMHPLKAAPGLARKPRRLVAALAACVLGLCFSASPARAEITFLNAWGSLGSGDGQFDEPFGVAVSPTAEVYVTDRNNYRIQKFDSAGGFLTRWGS